MLRTVRQCSALYHFLPAEETFKSPLLPALLAASCARLAIHQHLVEAIE